MNQLDDQLMNVIRTAVGLLVHGEYKELEQLTHGKRLTASMIGIAVSQYGKKLRMPDNYDLIDVVPIKESGSQAWSVYIPLFTVEEGRSDLTLLLQVRRDEGGRITLQLDDIRVL